MSTHGIEIRRDFNDNLTRIYLGDKLTIWFSYETIVAFAVSGEGTFKVRKMRYSKTTARHLSSIPAHELEDDEFDKRIERLLTAISFVTLKHKDMLVTELAHEKTPVTPEEDPHPWRCDGHEDGFVCRSAGQEKHIWKLAPRTVAEREAEAVSA